MAIEQQFPLSQQFELISEDFGYEKMDCVYKELVDYKGEDTRDEQKIYLKEPVENPQIMLSIEFDILSWWKVHKMKYHILAEMAVDLLDIQVSSMVSESVFSISGMILEPSRNCLTHYIIEVLICTMQWIHADIKLSQQVTTNEQLFADVELLDQLEKGLHPSKYT